jgi:hypothetical protein
MDYPVVICFSFERSYTAQVRSIQRASYEQRVMHSNLRLNFAADNSTTSSMRLPLQIVLWKDYAKSVLKANEWKSMTNCKGGMSGLASEQLRLTS